MNIYLDTHVVIHLHDGRFGKFSERCKKFMNEGNIFVAPIVKLELEYLFEINRLKIKPEKILEHLHQLMFFEIDDTAFINIVNIALPLQWTRDPFDRLIVAYAKAKDAHLVSFDKKIIEHYSKVLN